MSGAGRQSRPSIDYDDFQHAVYARGRAHSPMTQALWTATFGRYLPRSTWLRLLDVGSGTGRFSVLLAEAFDGQVVGVEPSARMRGVAAEAPHERVRYLAGQAESLPVPRASFDAALLSDVVHHIGDLDAATRELHRVLTAEGVVFVRTVVRERQTELIAPRFFPEALPIALKQMLSTDELRGSFASGGLELVAHEIVVQESAPSLAAYADRMRLRASSTFELLDDEAFERGMAALDAAAAAERAPTPVREGIDLFVFRRSVARTDE